MTALLQAKAQLLQATINNLPAKATTKLSDQDSISKTHASSFLDEKLDDLNPQEYTAKMKGINESLQTYKSKITDTEELAWIEHYSGQLDQMEGVVKQYQGKLLNLEELQTFKGYGQQVKQLSQESSGYFQELQDIITGGLTEESLPAGAGPLMKQLESKKGQI